MIRSLRLFLLLSVFSVTAAFAQTTSGTWSMRGDFYGPGSTGNELYVAVSNTVTLESATIEVHFDNTVVEMQSGYEILGRAVGMNVLAGAITTRQRYVLVAVDTIASRGIVAGNGDILRVPFNVKSTVASGAVTTLTLTGQNGTPVLATLNVTLEGAPVQAVNIVSPENNSRFEVDEGRQLSLLFRVENEGETLTVDAGTLPAGARMVSDTLFQWTPAHDQSGIYNLRLIYSNETGAADTVNFTITVNDRNQSPVWPAQADTIRIPEGQALSHSFTPAVDPDPLDLITYTALNLPAGAQFTGAAVLLSWTPPFGSAGTYQFSLVATDNKGARASRVFTLIVEKVNRKPSLSTAGRSISVTELDEVRFSVSASDPDGDPVQISVLSLPAGAAFNGVVFGWRNPPAGNHEVTFIGRDPGGLADTLNVAISVAAFNYAPRFVALRDTSVEAGQALQITFQATDQNQQDVLTYSIRPRAGTSILNRGATLAGATLSWTPTASDIGPNIVLVRVTDDKGAYDEGQITITVTGRNIVSPPAFRALADQTLTEGEAFLFDLPLVDPGLTGLRFWADNRPQGATLDSLTGRFRWTPNLRQSGSYTVTFGVTDGNFQDTKKMLLIVAEKDVPPVLSRIGNLTVREGELLRVKLSAADSSGEAVSFSAQGLPTGAEFFPQGLLLFRPGYNQSGPYQVTFIVTDLSGNTDSETVTLTVQDVNRRPKFSEVDAQTVSEGALLSFEVEAEDPDGDALVYAAADLPSGAQFNSQTRTFSWTPSFGQSGNYTVLFTASDGKTGGTDSASVVISVGDVNRPPRIDPVGDQTVAEGATLSFGVVASDPDAANNITISAQGLPAGATTTQSGTNPATLTVSLTPGYTQAGVYNVVFTATDNNPVQPLSVRRTVRLEVTDTDVAPAFTGVLAGTADSVVMSVSEGQRLEFEVSAGDPGGDQLSYAIISAPRNASAQLGSAPRRVTFNPDYDQSGRHEIALMVTDGRHEVLKTVVVNVAEVNRPPRVPAIADQKVNEGEIITFAVDATDADGDSITVFTAGRVPFLTAGTPPPARIRDGNVFLFDTALLPANQPIESAVFQFWAVDSRGGVSDTVNVEIAVVRADSANVPEVQPNTDYDVLQSLLAALSMERIRIRNRGLGNISSFRLRFRNTSGFLQNMRRPSLASDSDDPDGKVKADRPGVYSFLAADLVSDFYGIRRGWGLDLTSLATSGATSFPAGVSPTITLTYFDEDLPTEVPNFTESRLSVFGYDAIQGIWVMMDSVQVDTLANKASFVPTDPRISDYTIGAVLDVVAPQITNLRVSSAAGTITPAPVDSVFGLDGNYQVRVNITDDEVVSETSARLYYSIDGGPFTDIGFTRQPGNLFVAQIQAGAQVAGTVIGYYIVVQDNMNVVTLPAGAPQNTYSLKLLEQTQVPGDIDGNDKIDIFDLLALLRVLGGSQPASFVSDVNSDGKTDIFDLLALLRLLAG